MGYVDFSEPFTRLLNQGMVLMDGSAMSKSRGNLVALSEELEKHGVDAIRLSMVFAGPPEDDVDWADVSPTGSSKFLHRAWRLAGDVKSEPGIDFSKGDLELRKVSHKALSDISFAVESFRFNVVVARIMELVNAARKAIDSGVGPSDAAVREAVEIVAISLSLIAPYTAEEMWEVLGHQPSVARAGWPSVDPQLLTQDSVTAIFQINGKIKSRVEVSPNITDEALEKMALSDSAIVSDLGGVNPKKVITKAPKFVNIVL
jgi:leucyl-tRNA synthetase